MSAGPTLSLDAVHSEGVALTLASLRAYWSKHDHFAIAWSGGKDSTAALTILIHLIDSGQLPQPQRLHVFYADTRQELPPIQAAAEAIMAKLAGRNWITVHVVRATIDKRFMVYILGRGVPPPNNNTLRWCTRQIKVDPMAGALEVALDSMPGSALMITGVREGESAIRDGRISMSCSKDGAECGQGWYRARVDLINTEEEARIRELIAARTFPDKWNGDEPGAHLWLDAVYADGTEQPILYRELVGT